MGFRNSTHDGYSELRTNCLQVILQRFLKLPENSARILNAFGHAIPIELKTVAMEGHMSETPIGSQFGR